MATSDPHRSASLGSTVLLCAPVGGCIAQPLKPAGGCITRPLRPGSLWAQCKRSGQAEREQQPGHRLNTRRTGQYPDHSVETKCAQFLQQNVAESECHPQTWPLGQLAAAGTVEPELSHSKPRMAATTINLL